MPSGFAIDLWSPFFWVFLGIAVMVLLPVTDPRWRHRLTAVANMAFIGFLAGPQGVAAALGFSLLLYFAAVPGARGRSTANRVLLVPVAVVVLTLFVIHKTRPFNERVGHLAHSATLLSIVGFSYVSLRALDLLRGGAEPAPGRPVTWIEATSYLFPFHMLAAGPVEAWDDFVRHRDAPPRLMLDGTLNAVERIVAGLFKKFVLARALELAFLTGFRAGWPYVCLEIQVYYIWVYLDFSAYTDIAVGAGRLLGIHTPENFRRPLMARNIVEFWERWHISLSSFIRRNTFVPVQLGLLRRRPSLSPTVAYTVAITVAFVLCGLWHGLSARYLLWGLGHAIALTACVWYNRFLIARLGSAGMSAYRSNPFIRVAATMLTFEFVALSLAFIVHPGTAFLE